MNELITILSARDDICENYDKHRERKLPVPFYMNILNKMKSKSHTKFSFEKNKLLYGKIFFLFVFVLSLN